MNPRAIHAGTRLLCVLGHPVGHSLSPAMHNAALAALDEDAVYTAFDVAPERLPDALRGLGALGVVGTNLTIPHKEAALPLMAEVSREAALIGAVNTVHFRPGGPYGDNTDARGFLLALRAAGFDAAAGRALLLGAGGSARAVAVALAGQGATLAVANRTPERAERLAALVNEHFGPHRAAAVALDGPALGHALATADLLVNTTSVGMKANRRTTNDERPARDGESGGAGDGGTGTAEHQTPDTGHGTPDTGHPVETLLVPPEALREELFVCDLVYSPPETPLLAAARARGCRAANGLGMLAWQGALALELWLGRPAPVEVMAAALEASLEGR